MLKLNNKLLELYQVHGIPAENRAGALGFSNFCNPKSKHKEFPVLAGLKARTIRYLAPLATSICKEEEVPGDEYSQHRSKMMQHCELIYDCMDQCDMHLDDTTFKSVNDSVLMFLFHYTNAARFNFLVAWVGGIIL